MLADFGARVIKLEPKGAGDIARAWGTLRVKERTRRRLARAGRDRGAIDAVTALQSPTTTS